MRMIVCAAAAASLVGVETGTAQIPGVAQLPGAAQVPGAARLPGAAQNRVGVTSMFADFTNSVGSVFQDAPAGADAISGEFSLSTHSQSFFRGFILENEGVILHQTLSLSVALIDSEEGFVDELDFTYGLFNAFHTGPSGESGNATADPKAWFENDTYLALSGRKGPFEFDFRWTNLNSPNNSFIAVHEVGFRLTYDDADRWKDAGVFARLRPSAMLVQEFQGKRDAGNDKGTYFELGVTPTFELEGEQQITVAAPAKLGFGLDYYERPGGGSDDFFGYFDVGVAASMPLSSIPQRFGSWVASANLNALFLGSNLKTFNGGNSFEVYAGIGVGVDF